MASVKIKQRSIGRQLRLRASTGDITAEQFTSAVQQLGMTNMEAGEWLGMTLRQGQRYASGETAIPRPIGKLLNLMLKLGLKPQQV